MSIKESLIEYGILGVGAYLLITNADKIGAWLAGQVAPKAEEIKEAVDELIIEPTYDAGYNAGVWTKESILDPTYNAGYNAGVWTKENVTNPLFNLGVTVGSTQKTITDLGSNMLNNVFSSVYNWFDQTGRIGAAYVSSALGNTPELVTTVSAQEIPQAIIAPQISNTAVFTEWIPKILAEGSGRLGTIGGTTGIWLNYSNSGYVDQGSDYWSAVSRVQNQAIYNIEDISNPIVRRALEKEIAARGGAIVLAE